ncbi:universal stress protein [Rugosimonospora africana]|uniref:UspA domain-containing protein n=1 Tax=Rugosimonospora africana TaxID=556532 RepID=A0A8J3VWN2_9ACTN|nr:universal stress protein [Rugosimonospora africana]GIH21099.1 hypothetical protein Raf01_92710 [Rugosimonospora africana]
MDERRKPRVIVGVSRSLSGLQALRVSVAEARSTGAQLWAVRSWREPAGWGRPPIWQFYDEVTQEVTAELRDAFAMAMGGLPADVAVRPLVLAGEPGQTLISVADRDNDLIVVGAGTRRGLRRGGRVARYCLRHASCDVLVVPAPRLARLGRTSTLTRRLSRELSRSTGSRGTVETISP